MQIVVVVGPQRDVRCDLFARKIERRVEDPTFQVYTDDETGETVIAGMGELHLEIYIERIRREYGVEVEVGAPKVSYRESATKRADFNFKHKKQTGGSGQYAHIVGYLEPLPEDSEEVFEFVDEVTGGKIPKEYIPSVERGFRDALVKGPLAQFPIEGVRAVLQEGSYHDVDSSDMAFFICSRNCFNETFLNMKPALLEPIMKIEIEVPTDFQGTVVGNLSGRRGMVTQTEINGNTTLILGQIPLAEMFGYSTDLRSMTQGNGTYSMEFDSYKRVPGNIQEDVIADKKKERELVGAK